MLGLEKDRGDSPPSYDSTGQARLNDTSHGVTLSITPPERGWFVPGETVRPTLHIPNDVLGSVEGEVQCSLEGKSSVEVMGKQRYQVRLRSSEPETKTSTYAVAESANAAS